MFANKYKVLYKNRPGRVPDKKETVDQRWRDGVDGYLETKPMFLASFLFRFFLSFCFVGRGARHPGELVRRVSHIVEIQYFHNHNRIESSPRDYISLSSRCRCSAWKRLSVSPTCLRSETSRLRTRERKAWTFIGVSPRDGAGLGPGSM